jgi:cytochrome P450
MESIYGSGGQLARRPIQSARTMRRDGLTRQIRPRRKTRRRSGWCAPAGSRYDASLSTTRDSGERAPDLKAAPNVQDPFPVYAWLRDHDPVHWSGTLNGWVVTRFADVIEIFNRPARFSSDRFRKIDERYASRRAAVKAVGDVLGQWLVFRDPPDHDRLRALLQKSFTPRTLEESRGAIQATVDTLLGGVLERGRMDFIRDVAFPLPATVIATLLGVPTDDIEPIKRWSDRLAAYLGGSVDERDNFSEASAGVSQLVDYFRARLRERERDGRDDLMSAMLRAEHEGDRLTRDEVVANCVLLLFAGHETTTNLLGNGLFHLLRHPAQVGRLRADARLVASAVEECLRYDGPVPATIKIATEDVAWHDQAIRRGDMVIPFMASANRDPRQFADPDVFDVGRTTDRHVAFAWGLHFCLGAWLARLEARLVFETVLARLPGLTLAGPAPRWKPMLFLRGLETLPLEWETTA